MKSFIVARHGDYDENLNLSQSGESQMKRLAQVLKKAFASGSIILLSSSAPRATQSSKVLSNELGIGFESFDELWSDCQHPQNNTQAIELILDKAQGFDYVIIMTHLEYAGSLPYVFTEKYNVSPPDWILVFKGEACCIDCSEKTCFIIP